MRSPELAEPADSTRRFSDRAGHYARWRPGYPVEVLDVLRAETGLTPGSVVADVGAGTGISTALFLEQGHTVFAVEPNAAMRAVAEEHLRRFPGFHSVDAPAERTTLPDRSVDYVVVAQAFHWFSPNEAAREFQRILRPGGWVVLLWNTRRLDSTPFLRAYEALLQEYGTDYGEVQQRAADRSIAARAFAGMTFRPRTVFNEQRLSREGLRGRLLSASYMPGPGQPRHADMLAALDVLFDGHHEGGMVRIEYDTEVSFAQMP